MKQIICQDYTPIEGFKNPHLVDQFRVIGVFLDGKTPDFRIEILLRMEGLGHRIGHGKSIQNLPEGNTHQVSQYPADLWLLWYPVHFRNHADKLVMDDFLVH